jgi:hypothetical protein
MIRLTFNEKKTTQAAAFLIKQSGKNLNYTKLIKLLYLADREAFNKWERSISGDSYVSMKRGPVLSNTYDLINYPDDSYWHRHIRRDEYDVLLSDDPGSSSLTPNEIIILQAIWDEHKDHDWKDMIKFCHECCGEWQHPDGDTSIPIRIEDMLKALDKTEREIEIIEDEIAALNYVKRLFKAA